MKFLYQFYEYRGYKNLKKDKILSNINLKYLKKGFFDI